jgi:hypothetical protein
MALATPAIVSVLVDPTISHRRLVLAVVAAISLLLGSLLIGEAALPAVWQDYSSDAAGISVLVAMVLTPFVAAFAVSPLGARSDDTRWDARAIDNAWATRAIVYGLLAWAGVGLQAELVPYVIPIVRNVVAASLFHQPVPHSGGGMGGWIIGLFFLIVLFVLYLFGFVYAIALGLLGGALRHRLARHRGNTAIPLPLP